MSATEVADFARVRHVHFCATADRTPVKLNVLLRHGHRASCCRSTERLLVIGQSSVPLHASSNIERATHRRLYTGLSKRSGAAWHFTDATASTG